VETRYIVQYKVNGGWEDSFWVNNLLNKPEDFPNRGDLEIAKAAMTLAKHKFPDYEFRIFPEPPKPNLNLVVEALEKEFEQTKQIYKDYSIYSDGYIAGLYRAIVIAKEAMKNHEENHTSAIGTLVRLLCTGEAIHKESETLLETFHTLFPSIMSYQGKLSAAERNSGSAQLAKDKERA